MGGQRLRHAICGQSSCYVWNLGCIITNNDVLHCLEKVYYAESCQRSMSITLLTSTLGSRSLRCRLCASVAQFRRSKVYAHYWTRRTDDYQGSVAKVRPACLSYFVLIVEGDVLGGDTS